MESRTIESFHTVLFCREWDACVAFYRDVLGFPVADRKRGFVEFEVAPNARIGLIRSDGESAVNKNGRAFILSFRVADVEEVHKMLSEHSRETTAVKQHAWGARVFELRDPEGRRLEFWTPQ
jgi:catechol 2,3-dioxygenase-like lactoylglutathione lyase family enzyme